MSLTFSFSLCSYSGSLSLDPLFSLRSFSFSLGSRFFDSVHARKALKQGPLNDDERLVHRVEALDGRTALDELSRPA